jgi:DNA topoisomerase-3
MAAMVRHFGDLADSRKACGICDFCAPEECAGQRFRAATAEEKQAALRAVTTLRGTDYRPTGKLHAELFPDGAMTRDAFEDVLGALARAGLVQLTGAVFEKDGRSIPYSKASLTAAGEAVEEIASSELRMKVAMESLARKRKAKKAATKTAKKAGKRAKARKPDAAEPSKPKRKAARVPDAASARLEETLRSWRLAEAKRRGVPAFRIWSDAVLKALAERRPATAAELLAIPGIGLSTVEKYGAQIYRLVAQAA